MSPPKFPLRILSGTNRKQDVLQWKEFIRKNNKHVLKMLYKYNLDDDNGFEYWKEVIKYHPGFLVGWFHQYESDIRRVTCPHLK